MAMANAAWPCECAGSNDADDDAADQLKVDRAAVGQGDARGRIGDAQRIADPAAHGRAVGSEHRIGIDDRNAGVGLAEGKPAGEVGVVTLDDRAGIDRRSSGRKALVHRHRRLRVERWSERGAVVEEGDLVGDVDRARGDGITVAVGGGDRHRDRIVAKLERIVRIRVHRMVEAEILLDAHHTGGCVDGDGKGRLARECASSNDADDDTADQLQIDRTAVGQGHA